MFSCVDASSPEASGDTAGDVGSLGEVLASSEAAAWIDGVPLPVDELDAALCVAGALNARRAEQEPPARQRQDHEAGPWPPRGADEGDASGSTAGLAGGSAGEGAWAARPRGSWRRTHRPSAPSP
ncbi:unnamed protein product [Prorocentrum cordatum]|uniref:Uncharacterized protein n=1 Tax=Prorocentrum cordatum TaxID=2364126 RepID=A0ABN9Y010_9DINO|nr:unnamed protein product [Polarella glacialis]